MSEPSVYKINKWTIWIAVVLIIGLLIFNILLLIQNRNLKTSTQRRSENLLTPGKVLPPLSGITISGSKEKIEWNKDNRKTLILIFSPRCGYCHENMPNWKSILQTIDRTKFRPVLVSIIPEEAKEYLEKYSLADMPNFIEPEPQAKVEYAMHLVPQTLLVDPNGKLEKIWIGLIQDEQKGEIENYLGVRLSKSS